MKLPHLFLTLALSASAFAGTLIEDKFTSPKLAVRDFAPARGTWKIADGVATCTQDDALYAKNRNHGPVIWYDAAITDATIRFAIHAEQVKTFVFTLNDEKGHVFRFVLGEQPLTGARAWKEQGHEAKPDVLPVKNGPKLAQGEWTQIEAKFVGDQCTLSIGPSFKQTVSHPAVAKKKTKLGLGFAFGTLAVRDVSVTTP